MVTAIGDLCTASTGQVGVDILVELAAHSTAKGAST